MKITAILVCVSLMNFAAHAADESLEDIIRKRDSVLSRIVDSYKNGVKEGRSTDEDVHEAAIRLYSFRRDTAKSNEDRIKSQQLIVEAEKAMSKRLEGKAAIGVTSPTTGLLAEERVLAAEQKLAELRAAK